MDSVVAGLFPHSPTGASLLSQTFDTPDISLDTAQRETEEFLTVQMPSTLSAVEYDMPRFGDEPNRQTLAHVTRSRVDVRL